MGENSIKENKTKRMGSGARRICGLLTFAVLIIAGVCLAQQREWCKTYITEEKVSAVDWEGILKGLGYEVVEMDKSGENLQTLSESENGAASQESAGNAKMQTSSTSLTLHARAAALIDADTGRVLYGKDELSAYPMASTTKIMTCIIALEYGNLDDVVTVSSYAASQPEVKLGIRSGETYILRDLLYATMLTSYNDCAVAIAEHIGGSVEGFADLMNQKARDLGCYDTWYITPNGLDAENEGGVHRTTAEDLAKVLAYAIKNEDFLTITRTSSHSFSSGSGKRSFTAVNKNAFLSMMDGALSGKTGYTGNAGYCYVGALTRDGKTFVAALLGSGWPPNKSYKWSDTTALMNYGLNNYSFITVGQEDLVTEAVIPVENGTAAGVKAVLNWETTELLAKEGEQVSVSVRIPEVIEAPALSGAVIGNICVCLEGEPVLFIPAILEESVEQISLKYIVEHIFAGFFDISDKV